MSSPSHRRARAEGLLTGECPLTIYEDHDARDSELPRGTTDECRAHPSLPPDDRRAVPHRTPGLSLARCLLRPSCGDLERVVDDGSARGDRITTIPDDALSVVFGFEPCAGALPSAPLRGKVREQSVAPRGFPPPFLPGFLAAGVARPCRILRSG